MRAAGVGDFEAERVCRSLISGGPLGRFGGGTGFASELIFGAAKRGLVIIPLESFTKQEQDAANDYMRTIRQLGSQNCATLGEMAKVAMESYNAGLVINAERDAEVSKSIKKRFDDALWIFPSLGVSHLEGEEIRGIGFMGLAHRSIVFDASDRNVEIGKSVVVDNASIIQRVYASFERHDPINKRGGYLIAIGEIFEPVMAPLRSTNPGMAQRFADRVMGMTDAQLEELDRRSAGIADETSRRVILANEIMGEDFMKVSGGAPPQQTRNGGGKSGSG